ATRDESALKTIAFTLSRCWRALPADFPVASHRAAVPSCDAVARRRSFGEKASATTGALCRSRSERGTPAPSQICAVPSAAPVAINISEPLPARAPHCTSRSLCKVALSSPDAVNDSFAVRSQEVVRRRLLSRLNERLVINSLWVIAFPRDVRAGRFQI